jgi:hypothetical protein
MPLVHEREKFWEINAGACDRLYPAKVLSENSFETDSIPSDEPANPVQVRGGQLPLKDDQLKVGRVEQKAGLGLRAGMAGPMVEWVELMAG